MNLNLEDDGFGDTQRAEEMEQFWMAPGFGRFGVYWSVHYMNEKRELEIASKG